MENDKFDRSPNGSIGTRPVNPVRMADWTRLPEFIEADRQRIEADNQLRRARARWIRTRRRGVSPELADDQAGIELAALRVRVARRRVGAISRLSFQRMTPLQAVWTALDDL